MKEDDSPQDVAPEVTISVQNRPSLGIWIAFGLMAFFGSLLAVGMWMQSVVPAQRINSAYLKSECVVLDKHVNKVKVHDFNPGRSAMSNDYEDVREFGYAASVQIRYFVAGQEYETWTFDGGAGAFREESEAKVAIDGFEVGQSYPCWYDPDDPSKAVIRRLTSYRQNYLGPVAAGLLGAMGMLGLVYCGVKTVSGGSR